MTVELLKQEIARAAKREERLIILVGRPGSGKSRILRNFSHYTYLDLTRTLIKELSTLPSDQRIAEVPVYLKEKIEAVEDSVLIVDNIEIMFLPEVNLDPLKTLANLSRNKTLVVAWVGVYDGVTLEWSEPGRPDYKTYKAEECAYPVISID